MTNNKRLNFGIKIVITVTLLLVIYKQVFGADNTKDMAAIFVESFSRENLYWLFFTIILMPVNWGLETIKWQILIQRIEKIPFRKALAAIFSGVTLALFTPNRIGEYGGRVLIVKAENNWKVVVATFVGNYAQFTVLVSCGFIGLLYFMHVHPEFASEWRMLVGIVASLCFLFFLVSYYNINILIPIFRKLPFQKKIAPFLEHLSVLKNYSNKELTLVLLIALTRYLVYSLQYYLMLRFFGIEIGVLLGLAGIATIFLLQTGIPLPPFIGLLARGEIALLIWAGFAVNEGSILAATFGVWIINLIIPALLGMAIINNINILKSLGYEKKN